MLTPLHPELVVIATHSDQRFADESAMHCDEGHSCCWGATCWSVGWWLFPLLFRSSRWVSDALVRFSMALMLGQGISGMELTKYVCVCEARPGFISDSFQGNMEGAWMHRAAW